MAKDHWFPCYVNDLMGSFSWKAMTNEERGAYWYLICLQMQTDDGTLPGSVGMLSRMCELDLTQHALVLEKFPEAGDGKRANRKALEVWKDKTQKSEKARQAAGKRHERTADAQRTLSGRTANAQRTHSERRADAAETDMQRARVSQSQSQSQLESEDPQTPKGAKSRKKLDDHNAAVAAHAELIAERGPSFAEAFRAYCAERANRREWMSERAVELLLKKLGAFDAALATEALNQSVMNGWQGVFPERVAQDAARNKKGFAAQGGEDVPFEQLPEDRKRELRERAGRI